MPHQVSPYYSKTGAVYHIYGVCAAGSAIKKRKRVKGKSNKKLCKACKDIRAGKIHVNFGTNETNLFHFPNPCLIT